MTHNVSNGNTGLHKPLSVGTMKKGLDNQFYMVFKDEAECDLHRPYNSQVSSFNGYNNAYLLET